MTVTLYHGEAMEVMHTLPIASVDAIVTDPPYANTSAASSFVSTNDRKGVVLEYQFYEAWLRENLNAWSRVIKPSGAIWFTCDWQAAMCADMACGKLGLRRPIVGVWWRQGLGMGFVLRKVYECFVVIPMRDFTRQATDEIDVWVHKWTPGNRKTGHSAEKPVDLYRRALRLVTQSGGVVLDPFMGSGTTGVACMQEGCDFIGIEREQEFYDIAKRRIEGAQMPLFSAAD